MLKIFHLRWSFFIIETYLTTFASLILSCQLKSGQRSQSLRLFFCTSVLFTQIKVCRSLFVFVRYSLGSFKAPYRSLSFLKKWFLKVRQYSFVQVSLWILRIPLNSIEVSKFLQGARYSQCSLVLLSILLNEVFLKFLNVPQCSIEFLW